MARRYVRDKIGRFASHGGGGGSFGGGGKVGKSAKNVKARAAYKKQSGNLRSMKKISGGGKDAKDRKFWSKKLGGAKSGMTRVTNRLTNKRAAKAKVSSKRERAATKAKALATERKLQKKNLASVKKAKATRAKTAAKKAATAKKGTYKGLTAKQQYKTARSKARAAKSGYVQDRGRGYDRAGKVSGKGKVKSSYKLSGSDPRSVGSAKAQVTKLQKKFGKGATKGKGYGVSKKGQAAKSKFKDLKGQRGGVTKGRGTVAQRKKSLNVRTTKQAFGKEVKKPVSKAAQKYIGKQNVEASRVSASRGKGSKAKRRAAELAKKRQSKGEKAVANRKKPERVRARKREEQGFALAGRKAYRKGPGAAERKAAVTGKTWKAKPSASKAQYKKLSGDARKNFRIGDARRGKSPAEIRGKHDLSRGVKKTKGAKKYIDTRNTEYPMFQRFKKSALKRKFKL